MKRDNELSKPGDNDSALVGFIQAVTGLGVSDKRDMLRDVSHLVQRSIQGHLATGLAEEYKILRERSRIKEDYETTDQCRQQTSYIFNAINSDGAIDEQRFRAMKNIFLNSAQETMSNRNDRLPVVLMKICSTLDMGEIMVLETAYRLNQELMASEDKTPKYQPMASRSWLELIATQSGLGVEDMVAQYEQTLMAKGLLSKRSAGGEIVVDSNYHLSGTGLKLCEFIKNYEPDA